MSACFTLRSWGLRGPSVASLEVERETNAPSMCLTRLERCNDVLERQVAVLRVSLEKQKRSQSVAEVKIRNMERAKADADRRNATLQKEMELFFQMYGEIKKGGGRGGKRERVLQSL